MISSDEGRKYYEQLCETPGFGATGFDLAGLRQGMGTRREPVGMPVQCTPTHVGPLPAEWVVAEGADPNQRLLYLHGGGYVSGSGAFYLPLAARISVAAQCVVLLVDYRLGPEHPFPAGLQDCLAAYEWLRENGPSGPAPAETMFVAGDSAGGGLTLAVLLALRDQGRPLPTGAIPLSPWTDMTLSGESIQSEAELDPIMHPRALPDFVNRYVDESETRDPLASPVFGEYTGLPPLLIQVGEHEIIRDDSVRVAARAESAGVDVTLEVWPGMFHVFQSHDSLFPENRQAIEHIASFMRSCAGR